MCDEIEKTVVKCGENRLYYKDGPFCMIPTVDEKGVPGVEVLPSKTSSFDKLVDKEGRSQKN